MLIRETIQRDLADEPQEVVQVEDAGRLRTDLTEYVLTDRLAVDFRRVIEPVVESARPPGLQETEKVGIWVSGFFGSGKSHFAKLAGHVLADTPLGNESAHTLFKAHLKPGRRADEQLAELLQQAESYRLDCSLVLFDISARQAPWADNNVGLIFLRSFYQAQGLSNIVAFAQRELELQTAGRYDEFLSLYEQKSREPWQKQKDFNTSSALFAGCLAELLPETYPSAELASSSLEIGLNTLALLSIEDVVRQLRHWLEIHQRDARDRPRRIVFVVDELGGWAAGSLQRIEQVRSFVETLGREGQGRIWLIVTSQERLTGLVQNVSDNREMLHRLEARFQINVHLDSSEVGTVIEDRVLSKRPSALPELERLWEVNQAQLRDVAESPGLELGANYPGSERDRFVRDYPFLPYQLPAAADIFGGMRGVKVSSGARSMIGVAFDAVRGLAGSEAGAVVSWDRIFDSANRGNEFADEQYLGGQGLEYLRNSDRDVQGPVRSSRLLKTLWLAQRSPRIPRTPANLARLLVDRLDADVLQLERDVERTLALLAARSYVRPEVATGNWRFLSQDEVTVEKIVARLAEDLRSPALREEARTIFAEQLRNTYTGRIQAGQSNTNFDYGLFFDDTSLRNERAEVQLRIALSGTDTARQGVQQSAMQLDAPIVFWEIDQPQKLSDRLRRAIAIEQLEADEEYRRVATDRTRAEVERLLTEATSLRQDARADVEAALQGGTLYHAGRTEAAGNGSSGPRTSRGAGAPTAKSKVETALRERIEAHYTLFHEGDRRFTPANIERLFNSAPTERAALDPSLALFDAGGHVNGNNALVEELSRYLKSGMKTSGQEIADHFSAAPYGWAAELLRYVAAAMFVDGRVAAIERSGRRYDDPKLPAARTLFGTATFRSSRLELEEDALTPAEITQARQLLSDLGQSAVGVAESSLKESTLVIANGLKGRLGVIDRARDSGLLLPPEYEQIAPALGSMLQPESRTKVVRALIAAGDELKRADAALKRLEAFHKENGFEQWTRSQRLLEATLQAGLADDHDYGERLQRDRDEIEALKEQRRVLEEFHGGFERYRVDVREVFKAVYGPLRTALHEQRAAARAAISGMPEFNQLSVGGRARVNVAFFNEGKTLAEVPATELRDEQQMLAANQQYSIAHLRAALDAIDDATGRAKAQVIELLAGELRDKGEKERTATWKPSQAFAGRTFSKESEVDEAFDREKATIVALIRDGKTVQVV
jgi:hypothetical protein